MCHNQTSKKIDDDQRYIVHHKVPLTPKNIDDPYITCGWDNLMLLCIECHNKIHSKERRRMLFDDNGNLIGIDEPKNN
ncbi:HNH endonuclease [Megamonas funiformis]|uniref:HNH endonuclease n=1 Tax=Megamonas funiformis TaxID=437897 RepID=UPI0022E194EF|nr:HNH endonuclease [Megamonas funiformis]